MVSYWPATLGPTWGPLDKPAGAEEALRNRLRDQTSILHKLPLFPLPKATSK